MSIPCIVPCSSKINICRSTQTIVSGAITISGFFLVLLGGISLTHNNLTNINLLFFVLGSLLIGLGIIILIISHPPSESQIQPTSFTKERLKITSIEIKPYISTMEDKKTKIKSLRIYKNIYINLCDIIVSPKRKQKIDQELHYKQQATWESLALKSTFSEILAMVECNMIKIHHASNMILNNISEILHTSNDVSYDLEISKFTDESYTTELIINDLKNLYLIIFILIRLMQANQDTAIKKELDHLQKDYEEILSLNIHGNRLIPLLIQNRRRLFNLALNKINISDFCISNLDKKIPLQTLLDTKNTILGKSLNPSQIDWITQIQREYATLITLESQYQFLNECQCILDDLCNMMYGYNKNNIDNGIGAVAEDNSPWKIHHIKESSRIALKFMQEENISSDMLMSILVNYYYEVFYIYNEKKYNIFWFTHSIDEFNTYLTPQYNYYKYSANKLSFVKDYLKLFLKKIVFVHNTCQMIQKCNFEDKNNDHIEIINNLSFYLYKKYKNIEPCQLSNKKLQELLEIILVEENSIMGLFKEIKAAQSLLEPTCNP